MKDKFITPSGKQRKKGKLGIRTGAFKKDGTLNEDAFRHIETMEQFKEIDREVDDIAFGVKDLDLDHDKLLSWVKWNACFCQVGIAIIIIMLFFLLFPRFSFAFGSASFSSVPTDDCYVTADGTTGRSIQCGAAPGTGDVTAAATFTDNYLITADGAAKGVQSSSAVKIDESAGADTLSVVSQTATSTTFKVLGATSQSTPNIVSELGSGMTGNLFEGNSNGGSGGDLFKVASTGAITTTSTLTSVGVMTSYVRRATNTTLDFNYYGSFTSAANRFVNDFGAYFTASNDTGTIGIVAVTPTYNQDGGGADSANTDIYVSRYEQAIGSGEQLLIDLGTNSASSGIFTNHTSKFKVSNTGASTQAGTGTYVDDADTIADSGDANPATHTLTPTSSYVELTCSDTDGCTVTMGETAMVSGTKVDIVNVSANVCNFADTGGVTEIAGAFAMGQYDSLSLVYTGGAWVETSRSNN